MNWGYIQEEFTPELIYIKGSENVVAGASSRHEKLDNPNNELLANFSRLSENHALNNEHIFHSISCKTIIQQRDNILFQIT